MKNIKYIKNALYCIEGFVTYEDLFTEKYADVIHLHMGYNLEDFNNISKEEIDYINKEINKHNLFEHYIE